MTERVAFYDRQPFIDQYVQAAHLLAHGGAPETRGGLLPHAFAGPLRQLRIGDQGVTQYSLLHEQGPGVVEDFPRRDIGKWNLDYTLQTVVAVTEVDAPRRYISPAGFMTEWCASLGEDPGESAIDAMGVALRAEYETYWLGYQRRQLAEQAKKHAGKLPAEIDDARYRELALDVPLRAAHISALKTTMISHIHDAHNIAKTAYDPLRDAALMTLTGKGDTWGRPYMSTDRALETLGFSATQTAQGVTE
jgi:hypothetical protein